MKKLVQIIFLSILGESALPIILSLAIISLMKQILVHKIFSSTALWRLKKASRKMKNNMWLIE